MNKTEFEGKSFFLIMQDCYLRRVNPLQFLRKVYPDNTWASYDKNDHKGVSQAVECGFYCVGPMYNGKEIYTKSNSNEILQQIK